MNQAIQLERLKNRILPLFGLLLIIFSEHIVKVVPYLSGTLLLSYGLFCLINDVKEKEYTSLESSQLATSLVIVLMGILMFVKVGDTLGFLGTIWGIMGLKKGINELNIALYEWSHGENGLISFIKACVNLGLAFVLIFDPFQKFESHIMILGIEIIVLSIKERKIIKH